MQLQKQRKADQELKRRVLKLEFCLQDARSQNQKLQRVHIFSIRFTRNRLLACIPLQSHYLLWKIRYLADLNRMGDTIFIRHVLQYSENSYMLCFGQMGDRRDKTLQELRDQLSTKQLYHRPEGSGKQKCWETPCFKVVVSMSMLALVVLSRR